MEAERKKKARLGDRLNKMFSKNETILLKLLAAGPADTRTLFSAVQHRMTEQGFYKCIRNLLAEEAITKEGRTLRVSQAYIRRSEELLLQMHRGYDIRAIDSVFSSSSLRKVPKKPISDPPRKRVKNPPAVGSQPQQGFFTLFWGPDQVFLLSVETASQTDAQHSK